MKLMYITIALILVATANAQSTAPGLTQILREECFTTPKLVPFEAAVQTFDYDVESERLCHDEGYNCYGYDLKVTLHYKLYQNTTHDYYTALGKLVTSKTEKKALLLESETSERRVGL